MPVSEVSARQHLRSASRRKLNSSRFSRHTFDNWAFSVACPTILNSLPDSLRDTGSQVYETFLVLENASLCRTLETWARFRVVPVSRNRVINIDIYLLTWIVINLLSGSTTAKLIYLFHQLTHLLQKYEYVHLIALDFSKAFDSVKHSTLAEKIAELPIIDNVYNWIVNFHDWSSSPDQG